MKLLIDGDPFIYRSIYSVGVDADLGEVSEKFSGYISEVFEQTIPDPSPDEYTIYLTGEGNFRNEVAKSFPYKGQRPEKPYQVNPLKEFVLANYPSVISCNEEADDLIAIEATKMGFGNCIIASIDKDFMQVPSLIYNPTKQQFTRVDEWSGTVFFYKQVLTGDRVDNIIGIHGIGPSKAEVILKDCTTEKELYDACVKAYDGDVDRVIENARLLWLRRYENQMWEPPND